MIQVVDLVEAEVDATSLVRILVLSNAGETIRDVLVVDRDDTEVVSRSFNCPDKVDLVFSVMRARRPLAVQVTQCDGAVLAFGSLVPTELEPPGPPPPVDCRVMAPPCEENRACQEITLRTYDAQRALSETCRRCADLRRGELEAYFLWCLNSQFAAIHAGLAGGLAILAYWFPPLLVFVAIAVSMAASFAMEAERQRQIAQNLGAQAEACERGAQSERERLQSLLEDAGRLCCDNCGPVTLIPC